MCFIAHNPILGTNVTQWEAYKAKYGKKYDNSTEDKRRQNIWNHTLKIIEEHNKGQHSYTMAMNFFGDFTPDEYQNFMLGTKISLRRTENGSTCLLARNSPLPDEVDWRKNGYVTEVKDQGYYCGSCWAFSATGSLEGQHFKKTRKLVSLSEQNLVDCSGNYGNNGCDGGFMTNAFDYIKANGGIATNASYPYTSGCTGKDGTCKYNQSKVGATCTGYVSVQEGSECELQHATATIGPISVAIDANGSRFQYYNNGVYDYPNCSSSELNHAVLVVGYGTLNGKDYWLVKNSWGTSWGMEGYILMSRNKNNQCGIATLASYPLINSSSCSVPDHENSALRSKSWGKLSIILSIFVALVIDGR